MEKLLIKTESAKVTREAGKSFGGLLESKKGGRIVFLKGDLGSGKTTFVSGILSNFGIKPLAISPTFVIMKSYDVSSVRVKGIKKIYHLDAYRLKSKNDLKLIGFDELKKNKNSIVLIEWPERIKGLKVEDKIVIDFFYGEKENERMIKFIKS